MQTRLQFKPSAVALGEYGPSAGADSPVQQRAARSLRGSGSQVLPGRETVADYARSHASGLARAAAVPSHTGLPDRLKNGIEALSGISLDDVRVHRNSIRPARLQALAHTRGSEIHLGPGQEHHLPHEAWHVVQQKQGRVRPTMQLDGTAINDDPGLEAEADRMGARATATPPAAAEAAAALPTPSNPPLQAVWIVRNGQMAWENDPYALQQGESYPFAFRPHVLVEQGTKEVRFDSSGTQSVVKRKPPPTHEDLQKTRESQGVTLRGRLLSDPSKIKGMTKELSDLAGKLETIAGRFAPLKNAQKSQNLIKGGEVLGEKFRTMVKAKDEFTQSEATAAHIKGLRLDDKSTHSGDVEAYAAALLRLMSSLRTPTATVLAPITHNSKVIGQQHPTSRDQPVLDEGASGHSFADRDRVQAQVDTFRQAVGDSSAGPNHIALASILSALSKTLASMSAPTSASNLPRFHTSREEQQVKERELIKQQLNLIAETLKIPVETAKQNFDEPWRETERPTSPVRNESTAPRIKKPRLGPSPLTTTSAGGSTTGLPPMGAPATPQKSASQTFLASSGGPSTSQPWLAQLLAATELQENVTAVADRLLVLLQPRMDGGDVSRNAFSQHVLLARHAAMGADVLDPASLHTLQLLLGLLNQAYRQAAPILTRRPIAHGAPEDPFGAGGERLAALEQVFAECGQMAAHNALAITGHPDPTAPGVRARVENQGALNALGGLANNIDENAIRQMMAMQGTTDIPVFGNIDQVGAIVDHLNQNDLRWLAARQIDDGEVASLQPVLGFMQGRFNSLTLILNTQSHQNVATRQLHWITVRVTRTHAGLSVQYLDSLYAPANYAAVFTALRQLLARAPRQAQPSPQLGGPQLGGSPGPTSLQPPSFGPSLPISPSPFAPSASPFPSSHGVGYTRTSLPPSSTSDWPSSPLPSLFPELDDLPSAMDEYTDEHL